MQFHRQADNPPYKLIDMAAMTYAKGLIDRNLFLQRAGEGIVRYQVWRGPQFLGAFVKAQRPTSREHERLRIIHEELNLLITAMKAAADAELDMEEAQDAVREVLERLEAESDPEGRAKLLEELEARKEEEEARVKEYKPRKDESEARYQVIVGRWEAEKKRGEY